MEYRYKPTTNGRAVMAACMALEEPFRITRVAFGSGLVEEDVNLADVHQLISFVSDGAVSERRHEYDRFYLTIQFANKAHPQVKTFLLTEFIVYVMDPVTGEETDLLYGTLGDYRQPVPGYNPAFPPSIFNFPLELIISDEINVAVSAPAGLVTHDELLWALDNLAAGAAKKELAIPITGWADNTEPGNPYPMQLNIASTDISEAMVPLLTVLPVSEEETGRCGLCPVSQTADGILRLYAKSIPTEEIRVSLTLLNTEKDRHTGLAGSAAAGKMDIVIPASGWVPDEDTAGVYPLHVDIANEDIREAHVPLLIILPDSLETAGSCGLSGSVRTLPGMLRVYAKSEPGAAIQASLALLSTASGVNVETIPSGYILPAASASTLGGVKVQKGSGLRVDGDGSIALDSASGEEVAGLFNGSKASPGQE